MKAIIWTQYGPPEGLQLRQIEKPVPKDNEVLIKIHAATVTAGDCEVRSLKFPLLLAVPIRLYMGPLRPRDRVLGQELAGEVEAVGKAVTRFKPGDAVFGTTGLGFGAYAEYICLPEASDSGVLATKPDAMTYAEAAAVPTAGLEALHFLRRAGIQTGQKVLVNGAGGSIGTFAVQLAKFFGAEVTGVDSTAKLDTMRAVGADHVVDYTREDFTRGGHSYDVIFDVVGKTSFSGCLRALAPNGYYLLANASFSARLRGVWTSRTSGKRVFTSNASQAQDDLIFLRRLIEAGQLRTVIDRAYPLEQTADTHRYVDSGQKKGHVVITVIPQD